MKYIQYAIYLGISLVVSITTVLVFNFFQNEKLGATVTTINATDTLKDSRAVINTNFTNLNSITKGYFLVGDDSGTAQATSTMFISSIGNVGISSTTPKAQLSIGAGGTATSTISTGKFCMYAGQENGTNVYVYLATGKANGSPFATSTTSCF